jgi:hypothetical protein
VVFIFAVYCFYSNCITPNVDPFDHHNFVGFVIPLVYLSLGYLTIYYPMGDKEKDRSGWPQLRFLILIFLFFISAACFPLDGTARVYVIAHLIVMAYFLIRFWIARKQKDDRYVWKWYYLGLLWSPAVIEIILYFGEWYNLE